MSCSKNSSLAVRAAARFGITSAGSKSAFVTGLNPGGVFSWLDGLRRRRRTSKLQKRKAKEDKGATKQSDQNKRAKEEATGDPKNKEPLPDLGPLPDGAKGAATTELYPGGEKGEQMSFFTLQSAPGQPLVALNETSSLKNQRQIDISGLFTESELDSLTVQLHLNQATALRHMRSLQEKHNAVDYSDPRHKSHVCSDYKNYGYLIQELRKAKSGRGLDQSGVGRIDTSSLSNNALVDLYEFSRFEADRVGRNIDHLKQGLSHLKGPTADYLTGKHRQEVRFYNHLAACLEPMITPEMQDDFNRSN